MKLICALILWQVLLQVSKEDTVSAEPNQIDKQSKNNETQILKEEVIRLKRELERKNDELKNSQEIETELRRELESKCDPVGKCSMSTVRGELNRQHSIMEKLEKNLGEKQNYEINKVLKDFYSKSKNFENCEKDLTTQEITIEANDKNINQLEEKVKTLKNSTNQLEEKVKELVSQLQEQNPKSCKKSLSSGPQYITLSQGYTLKVLCNSDIAEPGWTVIQQRIRGEVDFYRDWNTYRDGFGDFWDGDFFLGLEKIHRLTAEEPHELYIHMERFDGSTFYARYDEFAIAGDDDQYKLIKLGAFSGSTKLNKIGYDVNNNTDLDDNYAKFVDRIWLYSDLAIINLNGRYHPIEVDDEVSIYWEIFKSLKQMKVMIRPKVTSNKHSNLIEIPQIPL